MYVKRYPPTEERWQISSRLGKEPIWSTDRNEIFYTSGGELFSVAVTMEPEFSYGSPHTLFRGPYLTVSGPDFDVDLEGRFLLLKPKEQPPATQIHVVQNWFEELKRLVPTDQQCDRLV